MEVEVEGDVVRKDGSVAWVEVNGGKFRVFADASSLELLLGLLTPLPRVVHDGEDAWWGHRRERSVNAHRLPAPAAMLPLANARRYSDERASGEWAFIISRHA